MILRLLLDDIIQRLGLCDRVDLLRVRALLDELERERERARMLDPARHRLLTPAGGWAPYEEIEYDWEGGAG